MNNLSTIMIEDLTPHIQRKNNIIFEIVNESTPIKKMQTQYIKNNQIPNFNINFTMSNPSENKIYFHVYEDSDDGCQKPTLLSPLNKDYHYCKNVKADNVTNKDDNKTDKKQVKFSQDNHYFVIPSRDETKDVNHILFWSERDLYVFRKKNLLNNVYYNTYNGKR
jgi:hypothetical protein